MVVESVVMVRGGGRWVLGMMVCIVDGRTGRVYVAEQFLRSDEVVVPSECTKAQIGLAP